MNNLLNAELSNDNSEVNIIPANPPKKHLILVVQV